MEKLLVVSSFPPPGTTHHKAVVGVATYAKNTVKSLTKYFETITVLAEVLPNENSYNEENIEVKRIWSRNNPLSFIRLLHNARKTPAKNVLLELELAMFGGKLMLFFVPFFIVALRLFNKRPTVVFHQVITDISELSGHIYEYKGISATMLNFFIKVFYSLVVLCSSKVIVFDEFLKDRLPFKNKIHVIPHGVEQFPNIDKNEARKSLHIPKDDLVILYFGYIAFYKGADMLLDAFEEVKKTHPNAILFLAGGPNPNHINQPSYMSYVSSVEKKAKEIGAIVTGFVKEEDIPLYYSACDVTVFPYRTLMSASGPLSMSFSFGKPFLVSEKMKPMFKTEDIKQILRTQRLEPDEFIFTDQTSFYQKVATLQNIANYKGFAQFSASIAKARSWTQIGGRYATIFK